MRQVFLDYMKHREITRDMQLTLWDIANSGGIHINTIDHHHYPAIEDLGETNMVYLDKGNFMKIGPDAVLYFRSLIALAKEEGEL